jgi:hypothetical protein
MVQWRCGAVCAVVPEPDVSTRSWSYLGPPVSSCGVILPFTAAQCIEHIAKYGAALKELSLAGLPLFETSCGVALARGATALRKLDLTECPNVDQASVRSPHLIRGGACACVHVAVQPLSPPLPPPPPPPPTHTRARVNEDHDEYVRAQVPHIVP